MYKGNNVFIQKLLIFINMIILPVIIVLAWHFATSTLEQVKSVAVSDVELAYPVNLDERYITSLKNIEQFELDNDIITNQVDFDSWIDSSYLDKAVQDYQENAQ